ncbi:hypothetical protein KA405_06340 [Patescibacteria group bacterium]|nr:hypothetical protein [Patescibacteria group bacterium]
MPHTQWVYDPDGSSDKKKSYQELINDIEESFSYPVIVKMNKGTMGKHIYKCNTSSEVETALRSVFTRDKNYDFMALVQDYISIETEYRVVVYNNIISFVYHKDNNEAEFTGNLSPLHFE